MTLVTIRWQVEDGYVGPGRPHTLKVDLDDHGVDLEEFKKMSTDEQIALLKDDIKEDFDNKVFWTVDSISLS